MKLKVGGDKKNRAEYTNRTVSDLKLSIKRMGGRGKKRRQSTVHLNQINHTDIIDTTFIPFKDCFG